MIGSKTDNTQRIRATEDASLGHFWMPVREDFLKVGEGLAY